MIRRVMLYYVDFARISLNITFISTIFRYIKENKTDTMFTLN